MNNYITLAVLFWGLAISSSAAENAPRFENGILSIPRVDTPEQPGQYENARFSLAPDGRWDLLHAEAGRQAFIDEIEIQILESFPVQVHVSVSGNLPTPCHQLGPIHQRFADNRFEIAVHVTPLQTFAPCIQVLEPFQTTIPLDVYGLPKGSYEVIVNDKSASFELNVDNR
ncbi:MAG: hypothetical protein H6936_16480 [Burkholderiales bacterium]|nr:hypothetical protein [Nitrosomonas sp.]MCP5276410.1 hypothetical protein [Burkholderiales bacterium]